MYFLINFFFGLTSILSSVYEIDVILFIFYDEITIDFIISMNLYSISFIISIKILKNLWGIGSMDYNIKDLVKTLDNLKWNPYGIKDREHVFDRASERGIDVNKVTELLCTDVPVGIEKTYNHSSKFQLLYGYTKFRDLCIVIDILNEEEIELITIMEKSNNRRKHDGNQRIRS